MGDTAHESAKRCHPLRLDELDLFLFELSKRAFEIELRLFLFRDVPRDTHKMRDVAFAVLETRSIGRVPAPATVLVFNAVLDTALPRARFEDGAQERVAIIKIVGMDARRKIGTHNFRHVMTEGGGPVGGDVGEDAVGCQEVDDVIGVLDEAAKPLLAMLELLLGRLAVGDVVQTRDEYILPPERRRNDRCQRPALVSVRHTQPQLIVAYAPGAFDLFQKRLPVIGVGIKIRRFFADELGARNIEVPRKIVVCVQNGPVGHAAYEQWKGRRIEDRPKFIGVIFQWFARQENLQRDIGSSPIGQRPRAAIKFWRVCSGSVAESAMSPCPKVIP